MFKYPDGTISNKLKDFKIGEQTYPANALINWSIEDLKIIGIRYVSEVPFDSTNYKSTGITYEDIGSELLMKHTTSERYSLAELQAIKKAKVLENTLAQLATTDWYVIRLVETAEKIPFDVVEARTDIRAKAIKMLEDIDALEGYKETIDLPISFATATTVSG